MLKTNFFLALVAFLLVSACTTGNSNEKEHMRETYANEEQVISLQHGKTRVIVNCYSSDFQPAEICAQIYEKSGYIRVRDIPVKPAEYDFLKGNSYPSRRWREGEITPRW